MKLKVDASFEDGVFVPAERPSLADRERVRLTIEPVAKTQAAEGQSERGGPTSGGPHIGRGLAIALDFHPDGC